MSRIAFILPNLEPFIIPSSSIVLCLQYLEFSAVMDLQTVSKKFFETVVPRALEHSQIPISGGITKSKQQSCFYKFEEGKIHSMDFNLLFGDFKPMWEI